MAALLGCAQAAPAPVGIADSTASAPAPHDVGELCMDVGAAARACWSEGARGEGCSGEVCAVPRSTPSDFPAAAWRCAGQGPTRRCEARSNQVGPFQCDGARCIQTHPRAPDAGEWLCTEIDGAVYCHSAIDAAGVASGARDPAFTCGARRGHPNEPICVDFSPDQPPAHPDWRCSFRYETGVGRRVCEPDKSKRPRLGTACGKVSDCPRGALCAGGTCLPPRPQPACWLDDDCTDGAQCVWGSCRARGGS